MSLNTLRTPQRRLRHNTGYNHSMQDNEIHFDCSLDRPEDIPLSKPSSLRKKSRPSSITSLDEMLSETRELAFGSSDVNKIKQKNDQQYPMILKTAPSKSSVTRFSMTSIRGPKDASISSKSTSDRDLYTEGPECISTDMLYMPKYERTRQDLQTTSMKSLDEIRNGFGQFFYKCEDLSQRLKKVEKRTDETEKAYFRSMQDINVKIGDPNYKFSFWKENETYLDKKNKLKNEITRFKNKAVELERTKAFLEGVNNYLPKTISWDEEEHNKQQDSLDFVQKMILKEPQAFRIKKKPTKRAQISQRRDHIDMLLKTDQSDDVFAEYRELDCPVSLTVKTCPSNEILFETNEPNKLQSRRHSKSNSGSEGYDSMSLEIPKRPAEPVPTFDEITEEDSPGSSTVQFPQPVVYRSGQKRRNVRYFVGKSGGETVRRVCKPSSIEEEKLRVFEFKNDFHMFKKSTSSQRSQKTVRFNL